jgi:hypothetical protein
MPFPSTRKQTPYIKHEFFSLIFSYVKKEYGATSKREREKYEPLRIAK